MVKLKDIINSEHDLGKLLELKLPVKIAYKLSKVVFKIQPELKIFNDQKFKLVKELGEPAKDSVVINGEAQQWQVKPENMEKFIEEINKLTDIDVNLDFADGKPLEKIKIEDLGEVSLEPRSLVNLAWLIE